MRFLHQMAMLNDELERSCSSIEMVMTSMFRLQAALMKAQPGNPQLTYMKQQLDKAWAFFKQFKATVPENLRKSGLSNQPPNLLR